MLKKADTGVAGLQPARLAELFSPIAATGSVALAVSGGPDSLALMAMAARWRAAQPEPPGMIVLSVDHGIRAGSAAEAELVARYAREAGLEAFTLEWKGEKPASGLQAAARAARYRLMGEVMDWRDIEVLVTAHHMDDQAETILMRMAHGSGLTGLAGMTTFSEVEGVRVFRPLLGLRRRELEAVVHELGWTPVADPSNSDARFERARWRAAMPQLETLGLTVERLAQVGARLARADAALSEAAQAAYDGLVETDAFGALRLETGGLARLQPAMRIRVLARILNEAGGAARAPDLGQIEALAAALASGATLAGTTLGGCRIAATKSTLIVCREVGRLQAPELRLAPGASLIWDRRFRISSLRDAPEFSIKTAGAMPREELAAITGKRIGVAEVDAASAAPLVADGGRVVAIGLAVLDPRVSVSLAIGPETGPNH